MNHNATNAEYWKKCNICKKAIAYGSTYYRCSVSTCQNPRTGFTFCSTNCWDAHLGFVKHRTAYFESVRAPLKTNLENDHNTSGNAAMNENSHQKKRIIIDSHPAVRVNPDRPDVEILVVVSKVKQLVRDVSGMNTSQCAIDALTEKVVDHCLKGIERAKNDGRKTMMGRDII